MHQHLLIIPCFLLLFSFSSYSQCAPSTSLTSLDANNVSTIMLAGGDMWWDFGNARYEVPAGSGKNALFSGAIWMGGLDDSNSLHLASQQYRQTGNDFFNGPLDDQGGAFSEICADYDRHWKVTQTMIADFINGNPNPIPEAILTWPAKGNPNGLNSSSKLAPFMDVNEDGIYNAEDGDYPKILGDQAVWWVINDAGNLHTNSGGLQLGVEIHIMAYAYATNDNLNNTTFYNYTVINKSAQDYHDFYIGLFTDVDLGNSQDDRIGCNPAMNLGYAYNGNSFDSDTPFSLGYGSNLPMIGIKMLQQPGEASGNPTAMSSFGMMGNGGGALSPPNIASQYYNRLKGFWNDGTDFTDFYDGTTGIGNPTKFMFPGNPADSNAWSECSAQLVAGERKFVQSFGPMDLKRMSPVHFTYAVIWSQDSSFQGTCPDASAFFDVANDVQDFHDSSHCEGFIVTITGVVTNLDTVNSTSGEIDVTISGPYAGNLYYQWSDGSTDEDLNYSSYGSYTITVTDDFGCTATSMFDAAPDIIDGIETSPKELALTIYPNPSTNGLFNISGTNENLSVSVFDVLGNQVLETSVTSSLDLSHQPSGMYFVRLSDGQSSQVVRLMIAD